MNPTPTLLDNAGSLDDILNNDISATTATQEMLDAALAAEEGREYVPPTPQPTPTPTPEPTPEPTPANYSTAAQAYEEINTDLGISVGGEQPAPSDKSFLEDKLGMAKAFAANAANTVIPTTTSMVAARFGSQLGVAGGALTGPAAPVASPAGGLIVGLGAGALTYAGVAAAQDAIAEMVAPEAYANFKQYLETAKEEYPVSSFLGETMGGQRAVMKASISGVKEAMSFGRQLMGRGFSREELLTKANQYRMDNFINVVFGAGTEMAAEAARQFTEEGKIDLPLLGMATVVGATMNKPTALGSKITNALPFKPDFSKGVDPTINKTDEELAQEVLDKMAGKEQPAPPEAAAPTETPPVKQSQIDHPKRQVERLHEASDMSIDGLKTGGFTAKTDKYGISEWTKTETYSDGETSSTRKFSHPNFPDKVFKSKNSLIKALKIRKEAKKNNTWDAPIEATPVSVEITPKPLTKEQEKQAVIAAEQLSDFAKHLANNLANPLEATVPPRTLNGEVLNSVITREPEEAIIALAQTLKTELGKAKGNPLTLQQRLADAKEWLESNGFGDRVSMMQKNVKAQEELQYQILAARAVTERATQYLQQSLNKWRVSKNPRDLAEAVVAMQDVKKVLMPLEAARTNWGRMGHAFRTMGPEVRSLATVDFMLKNSGIEVGTLDEQSATNLAEQMARALDSGDYGNIKRALNFSLEEKVLGALNEAMSGSVMSSTLTTAVTAVGGLGETFVFAPLNGTVGGLVRLAATMAEKGKSDETKRAAIELKNILKYHFMVFERFKTNLRVGWEAFKTAEPQFGSKTSQLMDVKTGATPSQRGQRVSDETKGFSAAAARLFYKGYEKAGNLGLAHRATSRLTSESIGIDPNKNPMTALLMDIYAEIISVVHRPMLMADEMIKSSNAYAHAKIKALSQGEMKGLKGQELKKYVEQTMDTLFDMNNKLYTKQRVIDEVRAELLKEGMKPDDLAFYPEITKRSEARWDSDLGAMAEDADKWAKEITYQSDLGNLTTGKPTFAKRFATFMNQSPAFKFATGTIFVTSPLNIVKMIGKYTPTAFISQTVQANKLPSGRTLGEEFPALRNVQKEFYEAMQSNDEFRKNQAVGRQVSGLFMAILGYHFIMHDIITPGLPSTKENRKLQASKEVPYAFKINKKSNIGQAITKSIQFSGLKTDFEDVDNYYFEFKRIHEPTSSIIMAMSDLGQYLKSPEYDEATFQDGVALTAASISSMMMEKTYFNNFKQMFDLMQAMSDDRKDWGQKVANYFGRRTSSLIMPVMEARDPVQLELHSWTQQVARRFDPTLRDAVFGEDYYLPKAYNILGENVDAYITGIAAIDFVQPFYLAAKQNDELIDELLLVNENWSSPEAVPFTKTNEQGRPVVFNMKKIAFVPRPINSVQEPNDTVFNPQKALGYIQSQENPTERSNGLLQAYVKLGVKTLPEVNQTAYDRWQQNIGQIRLKQYRNKTLREALEHEIKTPAYQRLSAITFTGELNPRSVHLTKFISDYRQNALALTMMEYPEVEEAKKSKKIVDRLLKKGATREQISETQKQITDLLSFPNQK
jgi:hypothetical protein